MKILSFENFFLKQIKRIMKTETTSLNMLPLLCKSDREKEIISSYLFFAHTKLKKRINDGSKNYIVNLIDKYLTWDRLEEQYEINKKSLNRNFKILQNYDSYLSSLKRQSKVTNEIIKKIKQKPLKEIANRLNVSLNTASKLRKGIVDVSYKKLLSLAS